MNEAHQRFHDWLTGGAEGDPPRDVAVHASVCPRCRQSMDALDLLGVVNTGQAAMPPPPTGREHSPLVMVGRLIGATAVLFSAALLGVGVSQLIGVSDANRPVAQASPSPDQGILAGTATPLPTGTATSEPTPSLEQETLTPLGTPVPTHAPPVVTPIPRPATPVPTAIPTPTPVPTPAPVAPGAPQSVSAIGGVGFVELTWQPPASDGGDPVASYNVYRSLAPGGELIYQAGVVGTYFQDAGVTGGQPYYYVVTAVNAFGESVWSAEVSATPTPEPTPTPAASSSP